MGPAGAWLAERALFLFGPVSVLLLPLLYVFARQLWHLVEEDDGTALPLHRRWWRPTGVLLFAMSLLATVLALVFMRPGGTLPAGMGGLAGLLGAGGIRFMAGLLPGAMRFWAILAAALACLAGGAMLAGRVFALDWVALLTLPGALRRSSDTPRIPAMPLLRKEPKLREPRPAPAPAEANRRPTEIADPTRPAKPAQLGNRSRQGDLFDEYELPSLDLLEDAPASSAPKVDKLSLERNARLLETVLDDFNVKGDHRPRCAPARS